MFSVGQPGDQRSPVPEFPLYAGVISVRGLVFHVSCPVQVALISGSCAMDAGEPCQVRNEAALSRIFHVPQGRLG